MKDNLQQLLLDRSDLDLSSSQFDEILEILELVREKTIEECLNKGYCLYYSSKFDNNPTYVNIHKESLKKLK